MKGNSLAVQWLGLCSLTAEGPIQFLVAWPKKKKMKQSLKRSKKLARGTSLMAQGLRIRLPMQGKQVRALFREDPTCRGATKPVHHNY